MKEVPKYVLAREYAAAVGVDADTIRAWVARGKLPGAVKVGKSWMIPSGLPPPTDKRYNTGEYKDWRKRFPARSENNPENP